MRWPVRGKRGRGVKLKRHSVPKIAPFPPAFKRWLLTTFDSYEKQSPPYGAPAELEEMMRGGMELRRRERGVATRGDNVESPVWMEKEREQQ